MPTTADSRLLGYLLMHPDGTHFHDGATWRRFWGIIDGCAVCRELPKLGWHPDLKAAREAGKQLAQRGEQATPTRVRFLCQ